MRSGPPVPRRSSRRAAPRPRRSGSSSKSPRRRRRRPRRAASASAPPRRVKKRADERVRILLQRVVAVIDLVDATRVLDHDGPGLIVGEAGEVERVLDRASGVSPSRSSADRSIGTLTSIFIAPKGQRPDGGPARSTYSSPSTSRNTRWRCSETERSNGPASSASMKISPLTVRSMKNFAPGPRPARAIVGAATVGAATAGPGTAETSRCTLSTTRPGRALARAR